MDTESNTPRGEEKPEKTYKEKKQLLESDTDGRSKEWQDRGRVNLEAVPEGTRTNYERDFEPEELNPENDKKKDDPVY